MHALIHGDFRQKLAKERILTTRGSETGVSLAASASVSLSLLWVLAPWLSTLLCVFQSQHM